MTPILLGTSVSGRPDAARREGPAQASLRALADGRLADCVNLLFVDEAPIAAPIESLPRLTRDARTASGVAGPRKPLVDEMIDALAHEADSRGLSRVGVVNGDIIVLPDAIVRDREAGVPAAALSRTDVGAGQPESNLLYGVDMVTFDVAFWRRERARFRAYVLGEPVWDNVYAAIIACHGGILLNRERVILHERHPSATCNSPYQRYIQLLAARDSSYFSAWCAYVARAATLRSGGGTADEEYALQRVLFSPPGLASEALDAVRGSWWRMKRALGA